MPKDSIIHNVFYVSCLKMVLGQQVVAMEELPPLDEEGKLILIPKEVLCTREKKLRSRVIREYLIRWKGLLVEDAAWEGEQVLQLFDLIFLISTANWNISFLYSFAAYS